MSQKNNPAFSTAELHVAHNRCVHMPQLIEILENNIPFLCEENDNLIAAPRDLTMRIVVGRLRFAGLPSRHCRHPQVASCLIKS